MSNANYKSSKEYSQAFRELEKALNKQLEDLIREATPDCLYKVVMGCTGYFFMEHISDLCTLTLLEIEVKDDEVQFHLSDATADYCYQVEAMNLYDKIKLLEAIEQVL